LHAKQNLIVVPTLVKKNNSAALFFSRQWREEKGAYTWFSRQLREEKDEWTL
jgi:hypothetical protein